MSSREEEMLTNIANGEPIDSECICRRETFLRAIANNEGTANLPEPICREEELYTQIAENGTGGEIVTENILVTPTTSQQTIRRSEGKYINKVVVNAVTNTIDGNIQPENIKKDVTILGVTGTIEAKETYPNDVMRMAKQLVDEDASAESLQFNDRYIQLISDKTPTTNLRFAVNGDGSGIKVIKTSDGQTYTWNGLDLIENITHTWNDNSDIYSNDYGFGVRYIIYYYNQPEEQGVTTSPDILSNALYVYWYTTDRTQIFGSNLNNLSLLNYFESNVPISNLNCQYDYNLKAIPNNVSSYQTNCFEGCGFDKLDLTTPIALSATTTSLFKNCVALQEAPNLDTSSGNNLNNMFYGCVSLEKLPNYDTQNIANLASTFYNCYKLQTVNLDTSNVQNFNSTFYGCKSLETISNLNLSQANNMNSAFYDCSNLYIDTLNAPNVQNCMKAFYGCTSLTSLSDVYLPKISNADSMFYGCTNLKNIAFTDFASQLTSSTLSTASMFRDCSLLESLELNMAKVKYANYMFYYCSKLKTLNLTNTDNITTAPAMLQYCSSLEDLTLSLPQVSSIADICAYCINLKTVNLTIGTTTTNASGAFTGAGSLKEVNLSGTDKLTNVASMFNQCYDLETINGLDLYSVTTGNVYPFIGCTSLTNLTVKNIRANFEVGYGTNYGYNLTQESLLNTIKECWNTTTAHNLYMSTASKNILNALYVKLVTITDEMRAEDPYIDNKLPFEVCESTDEGAMTVTEYMTSKNWTIR